MAEEMGLFLPAYKRFERGEIPSAKLGYDVNASIVLDVPLEQLLDRELLRWHTLKGRSSDYEGEIAEISATKEWEQRPPPHFAPDGP
jgi:hypothetical protein